MSSSFSQFQSKRMTTYLAVIFAAAALVYLKDFSEGHALRHALDGIGFALLAYGTYKNGLVTESRSLAGRYASLIGGAFLLVSAIVTTIPAASALLRFLG